MPELNDLIATYPPSAYYRFESGALTTDSSGNNHTLTPISDPAEIAGVFGGGVDVDGNDAYSAVDHADFKPTGAFTIGAWVKSTAGSGYVFQSWSVNTNVAGIALTYSGNFIRLMSGKNSGSTIHVDYEQVIGGTNLNDNAWHFVVGTWDGSYLRVYVDGMQDASPAAWGNAPGYAATSYVRAACRNVNGSNLTFYTGSLDDLFLLNGVALVASQVAEIYRTDTFGACKLSCLGRLQNIQRLK